MYRRMFLSIIAIVLFSFGVFAGGQDEEAPAGESTGPDLSMKEAPQLAAMVEAGELPPLEERLPENPLVVEPFEELGSYGGTVYPGRIGQPRASMASVQDNVLVWDPDQEELLPHLASDWEANDDFTEFEISFRRGVKWSDGVEFTVDDVLFYFEALDAPEVWPQGADQSWIRSQNGTIAEPTKIDDYTVRLTFDGPKPLFLNDLAQAQSTSMVSMPKHYLSDFHPNYVDMEDLEERAQEEGYETPAAMWDVKWDRRYTTNPERPTLSAWMLTQPAPNDPVVFERNPYYWAVDTEGRQLPYIDQVVYNISGDQEVLNLRIVNGEIDISRHTVAGELPLYMQNSEEGDYSVDLWTNIIGSTDLLFFNLSTPNLRKREIFGDVRFRRAMSHAINREEINEIVYQGLAGPPSQFAPAESSPYYNPDLTNGYVEYDPERTQELLDEMGLPVGDDGFRTFPNGDPLQINVVAATEQRNIGPVAELWVDYMNEVGIQANLRGFDRPAFMQRIRSNSADIDASVWWGDPFFDLQTDTLRTVTPQAPWVSFWAPGYAIWLRSDGEEGVEPPEIHKRTYELVSQIKFVSAEEALEMGKELTDIAAENVWTMGTLRPPEQPVIVSNRLRNVMDPGVFKWFTWKYMQRPYQWYLDE